LTGFEASSAKGPTAFALESGVDVVVVPMDDGVAMSVPSVITLLLEPLPTAKKMTTRNEVTTAKTARRLRS
jgi:hypothetical protein